MLIYIREKGCWAGGREVFRGRGRKHEKDQWEKSENTKPVEIFSLEGSVSRYVYYKLLLDSDYPFLCMNFRWILSLVWMLGGRMTEVICLSTLVLDCFYRCWFVSLEFSNFDLGLKGSIFLIFCALHENYGCTCLLESARTSLTILSPLTKQWNVAWLGYSFFYFYFFSYLYYVFWVVSLCFFIGNFRCIAMCVSQIDNTYWNLISKIGRRERAR